MKKFNQFSKTIEKREWDHLLYLQRITLAMAIVILFLYLWILISSLNGFLPPEYIQATMQIMTRSLVYGLIAGILVSFIILLIPYLNKNWDLHEVVPNFLFFHFIISMIFMVLFYLLAIDDFNPQSYLLGYLTGGLISITAYAGEVKKEHSNTQ